MWKYLGTEIILTILMIYNLDSTICEMISTRTELGTAKGTRGKVKYLKTLLMTIPAFAFCLHVNANTWDYCRGIGHGSKINHARFSALA